MRFLVLAVLLLGGLACLAQAPKKGTMAVGGPFTDGQGRGGLVVLNVADRKEADALLRQIRSSQTRW